LDAYGKPARVAGKASMRLTVVHGNTSRRWRIDMLGTILIVILILMLLGALPTWPHSKSWGYFPSGGLGLVLLILLILLLLGYL
jgi:hypothetical protein